MPFVNDPCTLNIGQEQPFIHKISPTIMYESDQDNSAGETFKYQKDLPKLPIPDLKTTLNNYLSVLKPLQTSEEHEKTRYAAQQFLDEEGPELQTELHTYATDKSSYIEEFWYDSYLHSTNPVVLNLNPFFLLEDDPTPQRSNQIIRASSLIYSTFIFIQALRRKTLPADVVHGTPLCMSQFARLFGTARVPTTHNGCYIQNSFSSSRHIVIMAYSQFYYFDVFNNDGDILLTEKEIVANLRVILKDAANTPVEDRAKQAMGVLTTENRINWAKIRQQELLREESNAEALKIVDTALFVVCLDDADPTDTNTLCTNMLCGTYRLENGVQVGTCTNRWYDKLQIIVCKNGSAGINFEHTGVDGHTVLRYASDVYTETILRFANTINSQTQSMFHSAHTKTVPQHLNYAQVYKTMQQRHDTNPRKIEWVLSDAIQSGIRFAESRLSDLILQSEVKVLEFNKYGKYFITGMKMSPDAFVQMAFQAAYYGLYGKCDMTYEPAMTKTYLHGRTEAIHSVSEASSEFVKLYHSSSVTVADKLQALRNSLRQHTQRTKDCSRGLGQDRHLYALECVWNRLYKGGENSEVQKRQKPLLFTDPGWALLNHTVLSTSNCGNPALKLFGFGPTVSDGFGIGYIIKEDGIAFCASSKHRQTQRFLNNLEAYLIDIQTLLLKEKYPTNLSYRLASLHEEDEAEAYEKSEKASTDGYNYYDNGENNRILPTKKKPSPQQSPTNSYKERKVGRRLTLQGINI
ncbi:acyltransferase ChoActase/COT/CPT [Mycotypha africana]|uniref:acyltransferase ChoActase/COT/CPT n=1 Tax=Mycotypha africana TaxID=64632 RepID=UPI002300F523|nr:acyltransferase ChoActase/COT/CPT [Mycotypha africana]KAI8971435.1 acyltransferase ChoActase/COT/CPT [Mycotypha africana]